MNKEQRQPPEGYESWHAYWTAQNMSWRTEPEIDGERQRFLAVRQKVTPDIDKGIYPFRDEKGHNKLTRADVEWLAATHEGGASFTTSRGVVLVARSGPNGTFWQHVRHDLRGADLDGVNLAVMPLDEARLDLASLTGANLDGATLEGAHLDSADCTSATLRSTNLGSTSLRDTTLADADLSGADLLQAYLRGTDLRRANLRGANLTMASVENAQLAEADLTGACLNDARIAGGTLKGIHLDLDTAADLVGTVVASPPCEVPDVDWAALPLASIDWSRLFRMAEDLIAYWEGALAGDYQVYVSPPKTLESEHIKACRVLARSYQHLAAVWAECGLAEYAAHLQLRAERLRQGLVRRGEDPDYVDPDAQA